MLAAGHLPCLSGGDSVGDMLRTVSFHTLFLLSTAEPRGVLGGWGRGPWSVVAKERKEVCFLR